MMQQMMALIFATTMSTLAFAEKKPCENYAKFAAIKAYKAEMGGVQGSDGIGYTASLLKQEGASFDYKVTISDNNEDGETWKVEYLVQLQQLQNLKCKVLKIKKVEAEAAAD